MKTTNVIVVDEDDFYLGGGISFAMTSKVRGENTYRVLSTMSSCRSYMVDVLFNIKNPKYPSPPSYKYKYNPKIGGTHIAVNFTDEDYAEKFEKNIDWIHQWERIANVPLSKVKKVNNDLLGNNSYIVSGSGFWKRDCWKLSLYTYLIKTAYCRTLNLNFNLDKNKFEKILTKVRTKSEIFDESVYGKGIIFGRHSREGFVSILTGCNIPMAKYLELDKE